MRLDAASTRDTRLLFCTTGILLRRLAGDPALAAVSHVVMDEARTCLALQGPEGRFKFLVLSEQHARSPQPRIYHGIS